MASERQIAVTVIQLRKGMIAMVAGLGLESLQMSSQINPIDPMGVVFLSCLAWVNLLQHIKCTDCRLPRLPSPSATHFAKWYVASRLMKRVRYGEISVDVQGSGTPNRAR